MGKKMHLLIHLKSLEFQILYSIAISLQESLRNNEFTKNRILSKFAKLVANSRK